MIRAIKNIKFPIKESFIVHSILNYADKAINLISPIIILKFLHNDFLYNKIEYILSSSIILSVILDAGLSSYYFYGYRTSEDKEQYFERIEGTYLTIFTFQAIVGGLLLLTAILFRSQQILIYCCLLIRGLFLSYTNFKFNTYRVRNEPSKIFLITISVNVISLIVFIILYNINKSQEGFYFAGFFAFQILVILFNISKLRFNQFRDTLQIIKVGFLFSWPLVINVFILNIITNYGKVYAFNHLSSHNMTTLSVLQRFMVIIQLAHTSSISFFLKKIFDAEVPVLEGEMFRKYSTMLLGSIFLVVAGIAVNNFFHLVKPIEFDGVFVATIVFYVFNCYCAFLGTYFTLFNKNKVRLVSSIAVVLIYFAALWILKPQTLLALMLIMVGVIFLNLIYILLFLARKKIIRI